MTSLADRVAAARAEGRLDLPPLGLGTALRWAGLIDLAVADVDLARLAEAHVDAVQILGEAGRSAPRGELLGVWAAEHPRSGVSFAERRAGDEGLVLTGTKPFCSGAGLVDRALVTVGTPAGPQLVQVSGAAIGPERIDASVWKVAALREVRTATVDFDGVVVSAEDLIGPPRWYLDRPGFWHGAVGPAACWAGAAIGLVQLAVRHASDDPHALAHVGAMVADERALRSLFDVAGRELDAEGLDAGRGQARALEVRHLVDTVCADIEQRYGRCLGPRALALDEASADRLQALSIHRRQCHAERDLAVLGALNRA